LTEGEKTKKDGMKRINRNQRQKKKKSGGVKKRKNYGGSGHEGGTWGDHKRAVMVRKKRIWGKNNVHRVNRKGS